MLIIVGLGNPGTKFTKTRHNVGFRIVDEFHKENNFPDFKFSRLRQGFGGQAKKFNSLISKGEIETKKIILAKPQTFMNKSGIAVKKLVSSFNSSVLSSLPKGFHVSSLCVVHDDIDLPLGKIKIVKNRGSAGHKGVDSIIKELKTKNFLRLRIGIKPFDKLRASSFDKLRNEKIEDFVLKNFTKEEEKIIKQVIKKSSEAIKIILTHKIEKAMNKFNK